VTHETQVRLLLSSAIPSDARYCSAVEHFETIAENLAFMAPMVLLDLGASLTPINDKVLGLCDSVIVVLEPIPQSVKQTRALIDNLIARDNIHKERIDIALINRMRTGLQLPFGEVQDQLGYGLSVIFTPVPELAFKAQDIKRPMVVIQPDGLTAEQYDSLADLVAQKIRRLV
jgi:MinD-like ATPase involved in chromosome partitioning or flagellar assembly